MANTGSKAASSCVKDLIGTDPIEGTIRLSFGIHQLENGIPLVPIAIGMLAITEVFNQIERKATHGRDAISWQSNPKPEDRKVFVQAVLFPHLPYEWNLAVIDDAGFRRKGAYVIFNTNLDPYPYSKIDLTGFFNGLPKDKVTMYKSGFVVYHNEP